MQTTPSTDTDLRRLILDTTRHLLVQDGYKSLSMRRIAREIGYSATSIYLYFENKDALFHALIDEGMERLLEALKKAEVDQTGGAPTRLRAICRQYVDFGLSNPEYYEVMFMLHPEHMERYPAEKYRRARRNLDLIASVLSEGIQQGDFAMKDPRVTASTIWAALHGAVSLLLVQRVDIRIDRDVFIEETMAFVLQGVDARTTLSNLSS